MRDFVLFLDFLGFLDFFFIFFLFTTFLFTRSPYDHTPISKGEQLFFKIFYVFFSIFICILFSVQKNRISHTDHKVNAAWSVISHSQTFITITITTSIVVNICNHFGTITNHSSILISGVSLICVDFTYICVVFTLIIQLHNCNGK